MLAPLAALLALSPADLGREAAPGLSAIRPEAIAAHVRFLADDLLEGRRSGERGHAIAERYVAARFEALGLRPAGEREGWLQEVRLRELRADPARSSLTMAGGRPLRAFEDYLPGADATRSEVDIEGPLVFVGYGIHAPELSYDDTPGVDLAGKIVVWLYGAPGAPFPPVAKAVYTDNAVKWAPLARRGAIGIVSLLTPERLQIQSFDRAVRSARRGSVVSAEAANESTFRRWRATRYHQPSDDLGQPLDWSAAAAWARFEFLVALSVVQADRRPAWKQDDFFTKFLASHR